MICWFVILSMAVVVLFIMVLGSSPEPPHPSTQCLISPLTVQVKTTDFEKYYSGAFNHYGNVEVFYRQVPIEEVVKALALKADLRYEPKIVQEKGGTLKFKESENVPTSK